MKKVFAVIDFVIVSILSVFAEPNLYDAIYDEYHVIYNPATNIWSAGGIADDDIVLTKKLIGNMGSYSQYNYQDGTRAFTLSSDFEFVKDGMFITVDNANLRYGKVVYNNESFEEIPLTNQELQNLFPDVELIRLSLLDDDNKMWITKRFFKKKQILFVNDTDKYYYNLTAKAKKAQTSELKGLITLYRFGIYNFLHYGIRNGKITIYVR